MKNEKWNYVSKEKQSTGYEDIIGELKSYTKESYSKMSEKEREEVCSEVLKLYRSKNIYPIIYYNEEGIREEILKCVNKDVAFDGEVLNLKFNQGQSLCRFLMPNLHSVKVKGSNNNDMLSRFYDDHKLKRAIDFSLRFKKSVTPSEIRTSLEMIGGGFATNYKTMNAKALFEHFTPENGVIYDFAGGFGGRMLGALSSKNNYTYIAVEPCEDTYNNLINLGEHIENTIGRNNTYKLHKMGSEEFKGEKHSVDFAFSSPPYFNLEQYSSEETQCYVKYPTLEEWFEGYVRPTIQNIHHMLKNECYYAVNIADFNVGKERVEFVNKWIEMSIEEGFVFEKVITMKLQTRRGAGHKEDGVDKDKKEGIYVFKKIK